MTAPNPIGVPVADLAGWVDALEPCLDTDAGRPYEAITVADHLSQKLGGSRGLELNDQASRDAARIGCGAA